MSELSFRIVTGSYEHSILCVSVTIPLEDSESKDVHFRTIFHFQAHTMSVRALDVGKRYLVSGSNDEHIRIYDLQKRKELGTLLQHQGSITKLAFSGEGDPTKDGDAEYLSHKNGRWLLSGAEDGNILIWRVKDWEQFGQLKGHKGAVNDLSIHPSGRVAISVSEDRTVKLWNLMTARKASTLKLRGKVTLGQKPYFCEFDKKGGDYFVVGLTTRVLLYKTREASVKKVFTTKKTMMCMDFVVLDDKQYLVVGFSDGSIGLFLFDKLTEEGGEDEDGDLNEVELGEPEIKLQGHATRVKGFSVYQEKRGDKILTYIASISSDGRIVVWDMAVKDQVGVYSTGERLNVVATVNESVEKPDTMVKAIDATAKEDKNESVYESDGEALQEYMKGKKEDQEAEEKG